ncbi:MAG: c-type cytochrome [Ferruginibacter sp.]
MKHSFVVIIFIVALIACNSKTDQPAEAAKAAPSKEDVVTRGEYLVRIAGCNDCHSPKRMGPHGPEVIPELMLSGYPADRPIAKPDKATISNGFAIFVPDLTSASGPWGTSFAGNLTPDPTGIGTWDSTQFKKALTQGKYKGQDGGRMLLPPMPWHSFTKMTNEDVNAIFAYLKSIKPVKNVVPLAITPDKL